MNHLDEGTIHAWLDGGLDAAQSREIEAHVAGCVACAQEVAEARGLIAGASRILGALDYVPGGVIPRGASAAPVHARDGVRSIAPASSASRRWRVTRWASGIAAVLVGAIVLSTSKQVKRSAEFSRPPAVVTTADSNIASAAPAAAEERSLRAPSAPGVETVASAVRGDAPPPSQAPSQVPAPTAAPAAARGSAKGRGVVGSVTSARDMASAAAANEAVRDSTRLRRATAGTPALESVALPSAPIAQVSADVDVSRFTGCYRIDPIAAAVVGAGADASPARRVRAERAAAPSSAAPPAPVAAQTLDFAGVGSAAFVRLDSARVQQLGYAVLGVPTDSTIGSWRVVADSARLDLGRRGVITLSAQQKVPCP